MIHAAPAATGLDALLAPRGIVVIGASATAGKLGAVMARSLHGFDGALVLVNPRGGVGMHPTVEAAARAAAAPVDLAVLCIPAHGCAAALADAAAAGIGAAVVCAGGFAESGGDGARHQQALEQVAAATGIRVLGPNTSGFLRPRRRLVASFVGGAAGIPSGRVAVVASSGGVNHALAFLLAEAGVGISLAIGLGGAVDVGAADVLEHLAGDPETTVVALHLEAVADGRALVHAVERLTATRPVVALVAGRDGGGELARSHTGALATSWRIARAALRQAGAVVVDDERELVDAVVALSLTRLAPAAEPGVGVVTGQAGPGLLVLDGLQAGAVLVPPLSTATRERLAALLPPLTFQGNPVDTGRPSGTFGAVLTAVAADPGVDLLALYALAEPAVLDLGAAVDGAGLGPDRPAVVACGGPADEVRALRERLHAVGVPVLGSPSALAAAARALVEDARARSRRRAVPPPPPGDAPPAPAHPLDEHEAKSLLARVGVRTPAGFACGSRDDAHRALAVLGGPVAVKLLDAAVLHKTEVGGVHLGVRTAAELDAALDALEAAGARRVLVEAMAPGGVDLMVAAHRDPVFGPVVVAGLGGTSAEALADITLRLAPVAATDAAAMPDELAGRALLDGWRGTAALDRGELGSVLAALGDLVAAAPWLAEVEINPLRLTASGLVALDAVVTLTPGNGHAPAGR